MLSESDKFYIEQHMNKSPEELVEATAKSMREIKQYLTKKKNRAMQAMCKNGVTIMTQGSSEQADEAVGNSYKQKKEQDFISKLK